MKRCKEYGSELAACAAMQMKPAGEMAAHLAECPGCRELFAEFWRTSEEQTRAAEEMAVPMLRTPGFSFARLRKRRDAGQPRWRFAAGICGLTVSALILGVVLLRRDYLLHEEDVHMVVSEQKVIKAAPEIEPTWGTLRKQIEENREIAIASAGSGDPLRHLQLKDAYREWE